MYVKDKRIIHFSTLQFYNIFMDHKNKNWDKEHFKKSSTNGYKLNCGDYAYDYCVPHNRKIVYAIE